MPMLSDRHYPFNCLVKGFANTFERYQDILDVTMDSHVLMLHEQGHAGGLHEDAVNRQERS